MTARSDDRSCCVMDVGIRRIKIVPASNVYEARALQIRHLSFNVPLKCGSSPDIQAGASPPWETLLSAAQQSTARVWIPWALQFGELLSLRTIWKGRGAPVASSGRRIWITSHSTAEDRNFSCMTVNPRRPMNDHVKVIE